MARVARVGLLNGPTQFAPGARSLNCVRPAQARHHRLLEPDQGEEPEGAEEVGEQGRGVARHRVLPSVRHPGDRVLPRQCAGRPPGAGAPYQDARTGAYRGEG